ncbi:MAG: glycoside hydrolase family 1 protein [Bacteroidota bacterium]|nr:glycoside hydrolase family 1 protein [Bacteroidota bacterium]
MATNNSKRRFWFKMITIPGAILALYFLLIAVFLWNNPQIKWDWDEVDVSEIDFSGDFTWGVAAAAHQVEGNNTNNQWYLWETAKDEQGNPRILNGQKAGMACDHWNRYPEDIRLMKNLGVTAYRFSIEWSRIEPAESVFDTVAIKHYLQVCDSLLYHGIKPMITLHHFSNPIWFEKKGAFEKAENVDDFIEFVEYVYPIFSSRVKNWCTINEPSVYVVDGYFNGVNPPGVSDPKIAGTVLRNLLEAHVRAYQMIKSLPGGADASVGLVKNMTFIDPYNPLNLADWILSSYANRAFNESTLNFLETGKFNFVMPTMVKIKEENPLAVGSTDFIGLNYYSHYTLKFGFDLDNAFENRPLAHEIPTDMEYSQYPEGFYRAAKRVAKLGVPVIVTENGIADASDQYRDLFIRRYLYALSKAREEGVDIRGYYYWSLMDNFEWSSGYDMKFGLYENNFETQKRRLRGGAEAFREIIIQCAN